MSVPEEKLRQLGLELETPGINFEVQGDDRRQDVRIGLAYLWRASGMDGRTEIPANKDALELQRSAFDVLATVLLGDDAPEFEKFEE